MMVSTARQLLPISQTGGRPPTLLYLDHAGLSGGESWRSRVRKRVGALAWSLLSRPRF